MERQGTCIHNHVNSRSYVGASMHVLLFLAVLFFFVVDGWCDCLVLYSGHYGGSVAGCGASSLSCTVNINGSSWGAYRAQGEAGQSVTGRIHGYNFDYTINVRYSSDVGNYYISKIDCRFVGGNIDYGADCTFRGCSTPCEAEREYCLSQGLDFDADSCKCKLPCPDDVCDTDRQRCEQVAKGNFTGRCVRVGGEPCCTSTCDICNSESQKKMQQEAIKVCCGNGLAPPKTADICGDVPPSGTCGMNWSYVSNEFDSQWKCRDPNGNVALQEWFYEACYGGSSSSTSGSSDSGGSSGESGGSSGEGGGSSGGTPPYPEGCDECPWLDSILDTLTAHKGLVEQIYLCVKYPSLCDIGEDSQQIEIDSNILNGVKDLIDSNLELSREHIEKLLKLDTNLLKMLINDTTALKLDSALLRLDSALLKSDSNTRKAIVGGLGSLDSTTDALNDSTRKWLKRIADSASAAVDSNRKYLEMVADSIGITAESLKVHLDSIKNAIPKDILDSILKYQKEGLNDSIVISSLPGLDSILDSTVSYWKKSQKADSARHLENNDTARAIHEAIDGIGVNIGAVLGYGDTATSDLHEDMLNVKGSILGFLDSALKYWQERHTFDSSYRASVGQSIVDVQGSVDSSTRAISGVRDAVGELRDSSIKYLKEVIKADSSYRVQFGEKMGDVQGAVNAVEGAVNNVKGSVDGVKDAVDGVIVVLNSIDGKLTASGEVDTSYVPGWVGRGERLGDTIANETGLNGVDYGNDTTAYLAAERNANFECVGDSCCVGPDCVYMESDQSINDSLSRRVQRLADSARVMNEQYKNDSVTSYLAQVKDSVSSWNPLGVFDSTLLHTLGAKIPNTNTCPEHCSKFEVNIPFFFGVLPVTIDYGLCLGRSVFGGGNLMSFFRFLIRLGLSITCVTMVMWNVARFKR